MGEQLALPIPVAQPEVEPVARPTPALAAPDSTAETAPYIGPTLYGSFAGANGLPDPRVVHPTGARARATLYRSVQRRHGNAFVQANLNRAGARTDVSDAAIDRAMKDRSAGQPLEHTTRQTMAALSGRDFNRVRVHTDTHAGRLAQDLNAKAFTRGQDIYFAQGTYAPNTAEGRSLLAHELVHAGQPVDTSSQSTPPRVSQPDDPAEREAETLAQSAYTSQPIGSRTQYARPPLSRQAASPVPTAVATTPPPTGGQATQLQPVPSGVDQAVTAIVSDLKGPTPWWASERILNQFKGKDGAWVRAVLQGLRDKAGENGASPDGMIDWLFTDLTAEDSRELRKILVKVGVVEDLVRVNAALIKDRLEGYTSESDSLEIYQALAEFIGPQVDQVLIKLEGLTGYERAKMGEWLFGDMDRVNAERTRQLLFGGGDVALEYAGNWTGAKIHDLLSGYVSHADSSSIRWNFETTPLEYRKLVLQRLDALTRAKGGGKSVEELLMLSMDQSDYEKLRELGLPLGVYQDKRGAMEKIVSAAEWVSVVAQWTTCGVIGIATGILSSIWDIVAGLWDIVKAAWHLIWSLVYLYSYGTAGSENWLAVKDFFRGLKALGSPGKLWDDYWEGLKLEFKTIEGPLTDCRQAEFIVRKFINAVVNIILIFVGGYGLVKGAVSAVRGIAELAALVREVGVLKAIVQVARGAGRAVRKLVTVAAEEATRIAKLFMKPVETLIAIGRRINVVLLAVRDEGLWQFLRGKAGALLESEKKWWQENKEPWKARAKKVQDQHAALSDDASQVADDLNAAESKAPEDPDKVAADMADDAKALDDEVKALETDVTGEAQQKIATQKQELEALQQRRTTNNARIKELEDTVQRELKLKEELLDQELKAKDPLEKQELRQKAREAQQRQLAAAKERNELWTDNRTLSEDIDRATKELERLEGVVTDRLPEDVAVDPTPPAANAGVEGVIGTTPNQAAQLEADLQHIKSLGAKDVRVNQHQVTAAGQRVGINRPDVQYTVNGQRYYIEYEQPGNPRGMEHVKRILANDPNAIIEVKLVPTTPGFKPGEGVTILRYP